MPAAIPDQSLGRLSAWSRALVRSSSSHRGVARESDAKIAIAPTAIDMHAAFNALSVNAALITLIGFRSQSCRRPPSDVQGRASERETGLSNKNISNGFLGYHSRGPAACCSEWLDLS
jgi:hypothetical protein